MIDILIAVLVGLSVALMINKIAPDANKFISFFLIPLIIVFFTLSLMASLLPSISKNAVNFINYLREKYMEGVHDLGYIKIFPPIFIIFLILIYILYQRKI